MTTKRDFSLEQWTQTGFSDFNSDAEYQAVIVPLLDKLQEECERIGIPLVAIAARSQDQQGTGYASKFCIPVDIGRVPVGLLCALHAAKGEFEEMDEVMRAHTLRTMALQAMQQTKH